ncbi:MAG: hypothetical protein Q9181_008103, partial [Wetmoreana brouardii]
FECYLSADERQGAFNNASKLLCKAFPKEYLGRTHYDNWAAGQPYIQHVVALSEHYLREESDVAQYRPTAEFAKLMSFTGSCVLAETRVIEYDALDMVVRGGMKACEQLADQDFQPSTFAFLNHISGTSRISTGDFKNSERGLLKAIDIPKDHNPSVDHDIAMTLTNLGVLYNSTRDHEQARVYLEESLDTLFKRKSEDRDILISTVQLNLARNTVHKGDVQFAKPLLEAQLKFCKTRNNCVLYVTGTMYYSMGNLKIARLHFEQPFSSLVDEGKGTKVSSIAMCIYKLARISLQEGNWKDAEVDIGFRAAPFHFCRKARSLYMLSRALSAKATPEAREAALQVQLQAEGIIFKLCDKLSIDIPEKDNREEELYDSFVNALHR